MRHPDAAADRGTDTGESSAIPIDAPGEPAVRSPSTVGLWVLVLAGPAIWIVHFMAVYLAAEAVCTADATADMSFSDPDSLGVGVVVATLVGVIMTGVAGWICLRRAARGEQSTMYRIGALLAALSVIAIVAVGAPALLLEPC